MDKFPVLKILSVLGFIIITGAVILLYVNTGKSTPTAASGDSDHPSAPPAQTFTPRPATTGANATLNFTNNIGGSGDETLLNAVLILSGYYVIGYSNSVDKDFKTFAAPTQKLFVASMGLTGTLTNIAVLSNYFYVYSTSYNNQLVILVKDSGNNTCLLYINSSLNIVNTINIGGDAYFMQNFGGNLYIFTADSILIYNGWSQAASLACPQGTLVKALSKSTDFTFFMLNNNNLNEYKINLNACNLIQSFLNINFINIFEFDSNFLLVTQEVNQIVLTGITTADNQIDFVTPIVVFSLGGVTINKNDIGYEIFITDSNTNYLIFTCLCGEIISKTPIASGGIAASTFYNGNNYIIMTGGKNISLIYTVNIYQTNTKAMICGSISFANLICINNVLFVASYDNTQDYTANAGSSDIFMFSLV